MTGPRQFDDTTLKRRRYRTRVWTVVLLLLGLGAVGLVMSDNVMVWYYARQIANHPDDDPWPVMEKMVVAGPAGAKWVVNECRTGSPDGEDERAVAEMLKLADYDVYPYVSPLFKDDDPRTRAFAVSVAGYLRDSRYREAIQKRTGDDADLPEGWTDRTVNIRAHQALERLPK